MTIDMKENKEEDDVTLAEASTSLEDSNGKKKDESVDEATQNSRKEFEDTSPDSNVARYSKKCTLCNKVYHSRSGLHKHMKTHKLVDMNNSVNDLIVVADEGNPIEDMIIVDEEGNENNMILKFDNIYGEDAISGADDE